MCRNRYRSPRCRGRPEKSLGNEIACSAPSRWSASSRSRSRFIYVVPLGARQEHPYDYPSILERRFRKKRRRMGAVCHLFGELPVQKMICVEVIRVREKWQSVKVSDPENRKLKRLHEQLARDFMPTGGHVLYLERVVFCSGKMI